MSKPTVRPALAFLILAACGQPGLDTQAGVPSPILGSLRPATVTERAGAVELTLGGGALGAAPQVKVGDAPCAITAANDAEIRCTVPTPPNGRYDVMVTTDGGPSGALPLLVAVPPALTSLSPETVTEPGPAELRILGVGFGPQPVVTVGEAPCAVTSASDIEIRCTAPAQADGDYPVVVRSGETAGAALTLAVRTTLPSARIEALAPDVLPTAGEVKLIISGRSLGDGGTVQIGDLPCKVTKWTPDLVVCVTPPGDGTQQVVLTTDKGFVAPKAQIRRALPIVSTSFLAAGPTLVVSGQNFGLKPRVQVGALSCTPTAPSHTEARCFLPATFKGNFQLTVSTPAGTSAPFAVSL